MNSMEDGMLPTPLSLHDRGGMGIGGDGVADVEMAMASGDDAEVGDHYPTDTLSLLDTIAYYREEAERARLEADAGRSEVEILEHLLLERTEMFGVVEAELASAGAAFEEERAQREKAEADLRLERERVADLERRLSLVTSGRTPFLAPAADNDVLDLDPEPDLHASPSLRRVSKLRDMRDLGPMFTVGCDPLDGTPPAKRSVAPLPTAVSDMAPGVDAWSWTLTGNVTKKVSATNIGAVGARRSADHVKAVQGHFAVGKGEVDIRVGDPIHVVAVLPNGLAAGTNLSTPGGRSGYFPSSCLPPASASMATTTLPPALNLLHPHIHHTNHTRLRHMPLSSPPGTVPFTKPGGGSAAAADHDQWWHGVIQGGAWPETDSQTETVL